MTTYSSLQILPPAISCPFISVSGYLGLPPIATYAALNLWNFAPLSPSDDLSQPDSLATLHTFTSTPDESWFYAISNVIEARGGSMIPVMLGAMNSARANDTHKVSESKQTH
jgi:indoleamine 2,3-dioxygenase